MTLDELDIKSTRTLLEELEERLSALRGHL